MDDTDNNKDDPFSIDEPFDSPDEDEKRRYAESVLQSYSKALEEEWELQEGKKTLTDLTPSEIREKTKTMLTQAVPKAVGTLLYLTEHAKSESIRLKAATTIIERALGKDAAGLVGNPVDDLIREINNGK